MEPRPVVKPVQEHFMMHNTMKVPPVKPELLRTPPAPVPVKQWKDADVHFWSPAMRELVKTEFPRLRDQSRIYAEKFEECVDEIKTFYSHNALIVQVMDKMTNRKKAIDVDLYGVVPAGLLSLVWMEYVKRINEKECYDLFKDTLLDMAQTCVQGDSHRLLTILVALHRAEESA